MENTRLRQRTAHRVRSAARWSGFMILAKAAAGLAAPHITERPLPESIEAASVVFLLLGATCLVAGRLVYREALWAFGLAGALTLDLAISAAAFGLPTDLPLPVFGLTLLTYAGAAVVGAAAWAAASRLRAGPVQVEASATRNRRRARPQPLRARAARPSSRAA